jgi:PAS domain S-box-containing protein
MRHLNRVLQAICTIDRLLIREKDRDLLAGGICTTLVQTLGYSGVWIALLDETGRFVAGYEAGFGQPFYDMFRQLKSAQLTHCAQRVLAESEDAVWSVDLASICDGCLLAKGHGERATVCRLESRGRVYGLLVAYSPTSGNTGVDDVSLLSDLAGDIGFALRELEVGLASERADEIRREAEERYRAIFENASDAIIVRDTDGNILMANQRMADLTGWTVDELVGMNIRRFTTRSSLKSVMEKQKRLLAGTDGSTNERYEVHLIRKDGETRIVDSMTGLLPSGRHRDGIIVQAILRDVTAERRSHQGIVAYLDEITQAQEDERKRVARELHDETIQGLLSLGMDIDGLIQSHDELERATIVKRLEELRCRTKDISDGVRALTYDLRPPLLQEVGLVASLNWLTDDASGPGITSQFRAYGTERRFLPEKELLVFRVAQEALNNIRRHSEATKVRVHVAFRKQKITVRIRDNGRGFGLPSSVGEFAQSGKLGLVGMYERARLLGGVLTVESKQGEGTLVTLEVPLQTQRARRTARTLGSPNAMIRR